MPARTVLLIASLVVWLSLPSCTKMDEDQNGIDPPALNPKPVERVKLYVTAPATLDIHLVADYRIGTWLGMIGGGGTYCGPESDRNPPPDAKGHVLASREVPIDLQSDGSGYAGEFFIDRFFPGRCHWRFFSLDTLSPAKDAVSLYSEFTVNYNFDTTHSRGIYDQSAVQSTDLWCGADPSPNKNERGKMLCTSLDYFVLYPGVVSNELLATVPVDQRDHIPLVNIFPFTKSISLRYHDLEAENHAATKPSAVARGDAHKACHDHGVRIEVERGGSIIVNGTPVAQADTVGLVQRIQKLEPAPRLACFVNATPPTQLPSAAAMTAINAVAQLRLPLAVYTDSTFITPVTLK